MIVVILSSSILIAHNFYTESSKKDTTFDNCIENCEDEDSANKASTTSTGVTTITTVTSESTTRRNVGKRITTRTTTTTIPVTTIEVEPLTVLATGDVTKEGTNGSVTYTFYSNGSLVITGTGDGIMKDYNAGEGFITLPQTVLKNIINSYLLEGVEPDQDTIGFLSMAYILYEANTVDKLIAFYSQIAEISYNEAEETINWLLQYGFGENYENIYNNLNAPVITSLQISGVTQIGTTAFAYINLSNIVIPNSVTKIGEGAFANNNSDNVTVTFGNSITIIGGYAFYGSQLTSVTIPSSVLTIENYAFSNNNFSEVTILGDPNRFDATWEEIGFPLELMPE